MPKVYIVCGLMLPLCLSACLSAPSTQIIETGLPYKLSAAESDAVKRGVRAVMKDPGSALFRSEFHAAQEASGLVTVCGFVNGKNAFGGYTGDKPFVGAFSTPAAFQTLKIGGADIETKVVLDYCRAKAIPV